MAKYVNQTWELNIYTDRQFSIVMLRNEKLFPNTMITVTFPLTTIANSRKNTVPDHILSLDDDEITAVITKITGERIYMIFMESEGHWINLCERKGSSQMILKVCLVWKILLNRYHSSRLMKCMRWKERLIHRC